MQSHPSRTSQPPSIEQSADEARRRMASELAGLAQVERDLDLLERQLSDLRAQLVRGQPPES